MANVLQSAFLGCGVMILFALIVLVHRLFFHPLSRFPGPKIAAATKWYEAYYDLVKYPGGQFMYEIDRLHEIYGPIVRITPDELHVKDASWEKVLYTSYSQGVRDKYPPAAAMAGLPNDVFGTVGQEHHHRRRTAINPFFSRTSVERAEGTLYQLLDIVCDKLQTSFRNNGVVHANVIFLALTAETIGHYGFGRSLGLLEDDVRSREWYRTQKALSKIIPFVRQFPWSMPLALKLPITVVRIFNEDLARVLELRHEMRRQARHAVQMYSPPSPGVRSDDGVFGTRTSVEKNVWSSILGSKLPPEEKQPLRMADEAFTLIAAGGDTTSRAVCLALFHVLADKKSIMPPLMEELVSVMPNGTTRPSLKVLEKLPWLTGIVKETLRIGEILASRLPLIARYETLKYDAWCIPPGTPVSMSQRDVFLDRTVFRDPLKFDPSRWLPSNPELPQLTHNFYPFGRGERMCVGWHLAMTELYIVLATVFRRFDLELHDTVRERDVNVVRDTFLGEPSLESKGIRVKLSGSLPMID